MRLKTTVQVQMTQDDAGKRKLYSDDATAAASDTTGYQRGANSLISIDPETTEAMAFGDVSLVRGMYLEVDQDALVRLNGSGDALQMRVASGVGKAKLFLETEVTEVTIENVSTDTALTGVFVCWGDPTV